MAILVEKKRVPAMNPDKLLIGSELQNAPEIVQNSNPTYVTKNGVLESPKAAEKGE